MAPRRDNRGLQTAIERSLQDTRRDEEVLVSQAVRLSLEDAARADERHEAEMQQAFRISEDLFTAEAEEMHRFEIEQALRLSGEMAALTRMQNELELRDALAASMVEDRERREVEEVLRRSREEAMRGGEAMWRSREEGTGENWAAEKTRGKIDDERKKVHEKNYFNSDNGDGTEKHPQQEDCAIPTAPAEPQSQPNWSFTPTTTSSPPTQETATTSAREVVNQVPAAEAARQATLKRYGLH